MAERFILAGGSGFLGRALARELAARGDTVVVLTRRPADFHLIRENIRLVEWNGIDAGPWAGELNGAAAVVNLAGRSVDCVHTPENRHAILESRLNSLRALGAALAQCRTPPGAWLQCSAVGYYGGTGGAVCDEDTPAGSDFMADVCRRWEAAFAAVPAPATRKAVLRLGVVLGRDGGALPRLRRLTRCFLGGAAGTGRQGFSWVHVDDAVAVFLRVVDEARLNGVFNVCAPQPVSNAELMRALRHATRRPWCPPAPEFAVRLAAEWLLRTDPALVLNGRRCVPRRLQEAGFRFAFPELAEALRDLLEP